MSFSMTGAFKEIQATPVQRLVAYMLADAHNHQTGRCDLSVASLVRLTSLSERAVRGALKELEKAGHITRVFRRGTSTQYSLHPRKNSNSTPAAKASRSVGPSAADAPTVRSSCALPLQAVHLPPAPDAPKQEGTRNELTMNLCPPFGGAGLLFLKERVFRTLETSTPALQIASTVAHLPHAELTGSFAEAEDEDRPAAPSGVQRHSRPHDLLAGTQNSAAVPAALNDAPGP